MIKFKDGKMLIPPLLFQKFIMAFKKNGQIVLPKDIYDEFMKISNRQKLFWRDIPIICEES